MGHCGLYWVSAVPEGQLQVSDDGRSATLQMRDLPVIDQPAWPQFKAPTTPAVMSFRLVFKGDGAKVLYEDPQRQFAVEGWLGTAQLEASVVVPSLGFEWKSDPLETSSAAFAVIGSESNGKYYVPSAGPAAVAP